MPATVPSPYSQQRNTCAGPIVDSSQGRDHGVRYVNGALTHHSTQGDPENPGLDALGLFQRKGKQMAEGRNAHLLTKYTKACEEADVGFLRLALSPQPKTRRRYILNPNAVLPPVETYDPNNNLLYRHARPRHPSHSPHLRILRSHQH